MHCLEVFVDPGFRRLIVAGRTLQQLLNRLGLLLWLIRPLALLVDGLDVALQGARETRPVRTLNTATKKGRGIVR